MKTLYIDTHSNLIDLVLYQDGHILTHIVEECGNQQSSKIMINLQHLFEVNHIDVHDLSDIIVVNGPGSFTGIRLAVTIAKSLAYTLNIPIRVMSSLLIKAVSNVEKGFHWFVEEEKNGYYFGKFNDLDELINDYIYVKKSEYDDFIKNRDIILHVDLDYEKIFQYSRLLNPVNPHMVNPLYVKIIEVQK